MIKSPTTTIKNDTQTPNSNLNIWKCQFPYTKQSLSLYMATFYTDVGNQILTGFVSKAEKKKEKHLCERERECVCAT